MKEYTGIIPFRDSTVKVKTKGLKWNLDYESPLSKNFSFGNNISSSN